MLPFLISEEKKLASPVSSVKNFGNPPLSHSKLFEMSPKILCTPTPRAGCSIHKWLETLRNFHDALSVAEVLPLVKVCAAR